MNCVRIIMNDMGQNPEISRYINMTTSYSKNMAMMAPASSYAVAPASGFFLDHEPYQHHIIGQPQLLDTPPRYGAGEQFMQGQYSTSPPPGVGLQGQPDQGVGLLQQQLMSHQGSPGVYDAVAHADSALPLPIGDPSGMMRPLSPQGNLESMAPASSSFPQYQPSQVTRTQFWPPEVSNSPPGRNILPTPGGDLPTLDQLSQSFQAQATLPLLPRHPSHSSLQQHMSSAKPATIQLGVPDSRVGSILGRGGKTLAEIQALSRTRIRISQRGEFIPGTQDRAVTITGNTTQDVDHARQLLNQRLNPSIMRTRSSSELHQQRDR